MPLSVADSDIIERAIVALSGDLRAADDRPLVVKFSSVARLMALHIGQNTVEQFAVLFLDSRQRSLGLQIINTGTVNGVSVPVRAVIKQAIELGAAGVIVAHNHPSGDCDPSDQDRQLTDRLDEALSLMDIVLYEHMVVARAPGFPTWGIIINRRIEEVIARGDETDYERGALKWIEEQETKAAKVCEEGGSQQ